MKRRHQRWERARRRDLLAVRRRRMKREILAALRARCGTCGAPDCNEIGIWPLPTGEPSCPGHYFTGWEGVRGAPMQVGKFRGDERDYMLEWQGRIWLKTNPPHVWFEGVTAYA